MSKFELPEAIGISTPDSMALLASSGLRRLIQARPLSILRKFILVPLGNQCRGISVSFERPKEACHSLEPTIWLVIGS